MICFSQTAIATDTREYKIGHVHYVICTLIEIASIPSWTSQRMPQPNSLRDLCWLEYARIDVRESDGACIVYPVISGVEEVSFGVFLPLPNDSSRIVHKCRQEFHLIAVKRFFEDPDKVEFVGVLDGWCRLSHPNWKHSLMNVRISSSEYMKQLPLSIQTKCTSKRKELLLFIGRILEVLDTVCPFLSLIISLHREGGEVLTSIISMFL